LTAPEPIVRERALINLAFWLLTVAAAIGVLLVLRYPATRQPARLFHGGVAGVGLVLLVAGLLFGAPMPDRYGVALFGPAAAVLAGLALLIGITIALATRRPARGIGLRLGTHATLAVTAYVLLLAYVVLR
jgi:hypothetical protein